MAAKDKRTKVEPPHRVLREVLRHYDEFKHFVGSGGDHVLTHSYLVYDETTAEPKDKVTISISFWDLHDALRPQSEGGILSDRKRQAVWLNVIEDLKQKDVAEIMGITTVSVGQYVEHAMEQLSRKYFPELFEAAS